MSISYIYSLSLHDALPIFRLLGHRPPVPVPQGPHGQAEPHPDHRRRLGHPAGVHLLLAVGSHRPLHHPRHWPGYPDVWHQLLGKWRSEEHTSELQSHVNLVHLLSFPTRRSSDLSPSGSSSTCTRSSRASWAGRTAPRPSSSSGPSCWRPSSPCCGFASTPSPPASLARIPRRVASTAREVEIGRAHV